MGSIGGGKASGMSVVLVSSLKAVVVFVVVVVVVVVVWRWRNRHKVPSRILLVDKDFCI
jgi:F0F1-type ATP synthase membrane subunit a